MALESSGFKLTPREREVIELIASGESNKAIAQALGLSLHTIKRHVANILMKLDVTSRFQAGAWSASRHDLRPHRRL